MVSSCEVMLPGAVLIAGRRHAESPVDFGLQQGVEECERVTAARKGKAAGGRGQVCQADGRAAATLIRVLGELSRAGAAWGGWVDGRMELCIC